MLVPDAHRYTLTLSFLGQPGLSVFTLPLPQRDLEQCSARSLGLVLVDLGWAVRARGKGLSPLKWLSLPCSFQSLWLF